MEQVNVKRVNFFEVGGKVNYGCWKKIDSSQKFLYKIFYSLFVHYKKGERVKKVAVLTYTSSHCDT